MAPPDPTLQPNTMRSAFWPYWRATMVTTVGTAVSAVAFPLVALTVLDASPLETSIVSAAGFLGWLVLGLPAGAIVQRRRLRAAQVSMDLLRGLVVLSLPVAAWLGYLTIVHLILVALVVGIASVLFDTANATYLPAIVSREELTARNSLMAGTYSAGDAFGPAFAGALIQLFGPVAAVLLDACSYIYSALVLHRLPDTAVSRPPTRTTRELIGLGWRSVRDHPVINSGMWWASAMNMTGGALTAIIPIYLIREADMGAGMVGLLLTVDGLGAVAGSAIATRLAGWLSSARALTLASAIGSVLGLLIPGTTSLSNVYFLATGLFFISGAIVIGSVLLRTQRQIDSPPELLACVMGTVRFVSWSAGALGAIGIGVIATGFGNREALWVAAISGLAGPAILLTGPIGRMRRLSPEMDV